MILLSGKVGYRRLYEPDRVIPGQALFFDMFFPSTLRSLVFCIRRVSFTDRSPGVCWSNELSSHFPAQFQNASVSACGCFRVRQASDW